LGRLQLVSNWQKAAAGHNAISANLFSMRDEQSGAQQQNDSDDQCCFFKPLPTRGHDVSASNYLC